MSSAPHQCPAEMPGKAELSQRMRGPGELWPAMCGEAREIIGQTTGMPAQRMDPRL